jgi:hypothetical protein
MAASKPFCFVLMPADCDAAYRKIIHPAVVAAGLEPLRADEELYRLLQDNPHVAHEKTDVLRDRAQYSTSIKRRLAEARGLKQGAGEAIRRIETDLGPLASADAGALVDVLLSYRAVKAWSEMVRLVESMPAPLRETVLVQEQFGFALNRDRRGERAERVLVDLIARRGASSETYGILGRVYKDRWETALKGNDGAAAADLLRKAADAYRKGFEADWRDAYPGINAVTLMELMEPPDPRRLALLPLVRYAVERKIAAGRSDYWDYASLLELAVLASDESAAKVALTQALDEVRESWEPETTAGNLRLINDARVRRGESRPWLTAIIQQLGAEL